MQIRPIIDGHLRVKLLFRCEITCPWSMVCTITWSLTMYVQKEVVSIYFVYCGWIVNQRQVEKTLCDLFHGRILRILPILRKIRLVTVSQQKHGSFVPWCCLDLNFIWYPALAKPWMYCLARESTSCHLSSNNVIRSLTSWFLWMGLTLICLKWWKSGIWQKNPNV